MPWPSCKLDKIREGAQCRVELVPRAVVAVVIVVHVGVQHDDTEPIGGDYSEGIGYVLNAIP